MSVIVHNSTSAAWGAIQRKQIRHWSLMRILNCPTRSPPRASRRFPGIALRSEIATAAWIWSSFRFATLGGGVELAAEFTPKYLVGLLVAERPNHNSGYACGTFNATQVTDGNRRCELKIRMIVLGIAAVQAVGGIDSMKAKLAAIDRAKGLASGQLSFVPDLNSAWMPMITFLVYISVNWWATWFPGADPGGGGFIAQRMFSAKDEKNSLLATLWFNIAHYALRPWPWIVVGLASIIIYLNLADPETGYVRVMIDYLPHWMRGLMVAAFAAAFMSTIGTQLNWGASYLVNDAYRRFMRPNESDKHYVAASQWATVILTIVSAVITFYMDSIAGAWKLLIVTGAGTGTVLILRWYWWRINARSEVSSMISAFVVSILLQTQFGFSTDDPVQLAKIAPEPNEKLVAFYRLVRPSETFWKPIARLAPDVPPSRDGARNLLDRACRCFDLWGAVRDRETDIERDGNGVGIPGGGGDRGERDLLGSVEAGMEFRVGVSALPHQ